MRIGTREIGPGFPPYVIGEIGINHDGSFAQALRMIDAFAASGCDALKLQVFRASDVFRGDAVSAAQRYQLTGREYMLLADAIRAAGMSAIATVYSMQAVQVVATHFNAIKIASPDCIHRPLIEQAIKTAKPVIISLGGTDDARRMEAQVVAFDEHDKVLLMDCVSVYPCPNFCAGIRVRKGRRGYSDHTMGTDTGALAIAAGYVALEKHITLTPNHSGADHAMSLTPHLFHDYCDSAHRAWRMTQPLGIVRPNGLEVRTMREARQSIVAARLIPHGQAITHDMLTSKRPGDGLTPDKLHLVVGKLAARDIQPDENVTESDVCAPVPC